MLTITKRREHKIVTTYAHLFTWAGERNCGFSFDVDEHGDLASDTAPAARANHAACLTGNGSDQVRQQLTDRARQDAHGFDETSTDPRPGIDRERWLYLDAAGTPIAALEIDAGQLWANYATADGITGYDALGPAVPLGSFTRDLIRNWLALAPC